MNKLKIFNSSEFGKIRIIKKNFELMFCLSDICKAININNATFVARRLKNDASKFNLGGRCGETWFITEKGLYNFMGDKIDYKKFYHQIKAEMSSDLNYKVELLYKNEINDIRKHIKRKIIRILGGETSNAYNNKSVKGQLVSNLYRYVKKNVSNDDNVSSFKNINRKYVKNIHILIDRYAPPAVITEQILKIN